MKKSTILKAFLLATVLAFGAHNALAFKSVSAGGPDCPGSGQWCAVDPEGNWYVKGQEF